MEHADAGFISLIFINKNRLYQQTAVILNLPVCKLTHCPIFAPQILIQCQQSFPKKLISTGTS